MKRNLKDIEPVPTSHGVGSKRVLLSSAESGCGISQIAVTDLSAGEVALAHTHPDLREGFLVLEGELDVTLDDEVTHCKKDDFVYVRNGVSHELKAVTDARVLTIGCVVEASRDALYPMVFEPNMHSVVWGGHRLVDWKGLMSESARSVNIGESWEVSAVPSSPSIVANGFWSGHSLIDVISSQPDEILGPLVVKKYGAKLPLLVKFIDANQDLSIQVHPNDEMAHALHGKMGKSEMWYVIDAKPGACLYAGFKKRIDEEEYRRRIEDGSICDVLAKHEVRKGDVFYIPAGRVHAICGGILLAEVQQSSDLTYRIFDYNRLGLDGKPRELHTSLASKALDFNVYDEYKTDYVEKGIVVNRCLDTPYFCIRIVDCSVPHHRNLVKYGSFVIIVCISGECNVHIRSTKYDLSLREGFSCLVPAAITDYDIQPKNGNVKLLEAYVDNKERGLFENLVTSFRHISML